MARQKVPHDTLLKPSEQLQWILELTPRYSPQLMETLENFNNEVKNLLRCMALHLKDVAKVELHTNHRLAASDMLVGASACAG